MNSTTTSSSISCVVNFLDSDWETITLNCFRVTIAFLYVIWLLIATQVKELKKKSLSFLYNLAFIGLFYCGIGFYNASKSPCVVPTIEDCYVSTFFTLFTSYYSGYALAALLLYRLFCVARPQKIVNLKLKTIIIAIGLVWIIPTLCSLIQLFIFSNGVYYYRRLSVCSTAKIPGSYDDFIFYNVFGVFVPNAVIIAAYTLTISILRRKRNKVSSLTTGSSSKIEPLRITFQMIIYFLAYTVSNVSNVVYFWPYNPTPLTLQTLVFWLKISRILKWVHHVCPLGLMYFHTDLMKIYSQLFKKQ